MAALLAQGAPILLCLIAGSTLGWSQGFQVPGGGRARQQHEGVRGVAPEAPPPADAVFFAGGVFYLAPPEGATYKEELKYTVIPNLFGPMTSRMDPSYTLMVGGITFNLDSEVWTCPSGQEQVLATRLMKPYTPRRDDLGDELVVRETRAKECSLGVVFHSRRRRLRKEDGEELSCTGSTGLFTSRPMDSPWGRFTVLGGMVLSYDCDQARRALPLAQRLVLTVRSSLRRIPVPPALLGQFDCGGVTVSTDADAPEGTSMIAGSSRSIAFVGRDTAMLGSYAALGWTAGEFGGGSEGARRVPVHYLCTWIPRSDLRDFSVLFFGDRPLEADSFSFTDDGSLIFFSTATACDRIR